MKKTLLVDTMNVETKEEMPCHFCDQKKECYVGSIKIYHDQEDDYCAHICFDCVKQLADRLLK